MTKHPLLDAGAKAGSGENLTQDEMQELIHLIMEGSCDDEDIGRFLLALRDKGETVDEIAGAAQAMRRHMTPIRSQRANLLDTCGTGGDASGTFNISTAAALVAATAGASVAKHGNRSITSKTGSADVLAALGVNIDADTPTVERCLDELGICFCFAPRLHPTMRHVARIRKSLGVPTVFNLLGPLSNPASAPFQLLGVGTPQRRPLLASVLQRLGTRRAATVTGADGLDEVTLANQTNVSLVTPDSNDELTWLPEDFGIRSCSLNALKVETPEQSAAVIRDVLSGELGPARDIVVLNAAAALWVVGRDDELGACAQLAEQAIDAGAASKLLQDLAELSHA